MHTLDGGLIELSDAQVTEFERRLRGSWLHRQAQSTTTRAAFGTP